LGGTAGATKERSPQSVADHAMRLRDRVMEMSVEALVFTPPGRTETLVRQISPRALVDENDPVAAAGLIAFALSLAADLAIFAPSSSGSTAIDRYLRKHPPAGKADAEAASALRGARFRVIRVESRQGPDVFRVTDIATGEQLQLFQRMEHRAFIGSTLVTRLCPIDGGFIATGPAIPLTAESIAVARGFFRPNGKGLTNPERCAEAIYRHAIRHDPVPDDLLAALAGAGEDDAVPFGPEAGPISALAHLWASRDPGAEPPADELAELRKMYSPDNLIEAVGFAGIAADHGEQRLADAFDRIALVQIDTLRRRQTVSARAVSLDDIARVIDRAIATGDLSPADRARFADLRRRAGVAGKSGGADLDRLLQVIKGLRAKTVDQGCTEAEAMAAAAKVAELLDRYGLSLSDVELRRQTCEGVGIETTRRRSGAIDQVVPAIAAFFACRSWNEKTEAETIRHVFFGLPGDVEAAQYLYELVEMTFETETLAFKNGAFYGELFSSERRNGTNSFQLGLARGIAAKLDTLKKEREAALHRSSGRDLMIVKSSIVDEEVERLGLAFTYKPAGGKKYVLRDAYAAGREAGERFEYTPGIEA
jgi:hypothetical protein